MVVGALRDLGVGEEVFCDALQALGLAEPIHVHFERGTRQGIAGWKFHVSHTSQGHTHGSEVHHHHDHPHAHGRSFAEIRQLLESSALGPPVRRRALAVFSRIAEAEAKIHGLATEEVHFHEVGAWDSIADIVCACAGIEALAPERCTCGFLTEGSGFVHCAHGHFPLPAPATLEILRGIPVAQSPEPGERITPTGAAILAEFCQSFGPMPTLRPIVTGFGLGTRDVPSRPNVLRLVLGDEASSNAETDEVVLLESNLDDLTPELAAAAVESLFRAGALDVWTTPAQMKKNRPGFVLSALVPPHLEKPLSEIILRETTAFGVRTFLTRRHLLEREIVEATTPFGKVKIKLGVRNGQRIQATPEYSSCLALAQKHGTPVREVYLAAQAAASTLLASAQDIPSPATSADVPTSPFSHPPYETGNH